MENYLENQNFKIETIKTPEGNEVSFCPSRGGIITSIKLLGKEILYLDESTLQNKEENVRGGIPILFPNAGPIESPEFPNLKQHGFARDSAKWKAEKNSNGFKEILTSDQKSIKSYPYNFELSMEVEFEKDNSFTINQKVKNLEENRELPISMGLHPYFKVPKDKKKDIKFNFENGKYIEEQVEIWANGEYISVDNPKIKDSSTMMEITIPDLGTLIIDASKEYKKIWIWSMPEKDFICIEPVLRDKNGLVDDPENIKSNETFSVSVNFSLK